MSGWFCLFGHRVEREAQDVDVGTLDQILDGVDYRALGDRQGHGCLRGDRPRPGDVEDGLEAILVVEVGTRGADLLEIERRQLEVLAEPRHVLGLDPRRPDDADPLSAPRQSRRLQLGEVVESGVLLRAQEKVPLGVDAPRPQAGDVELVLDLDARVEVDDAVYDPGDIGRHRRRLSADALHLLAPPGALDAAAIGAQPALDALHVLRRRPEPLTELLRGYYSQRW